MGQKTFLMIKSESEKANQIYDELIKLFQDTDISFTAISTAATSGIVVAGGDGTMLRAMHEYHHLKIPFIGINAGSVGFLMNDNFNSELLENCLNLPRVKLHPLEMKITNLSGERSSYIAFNEAYVCRASNQAAKISIEINNILQMEELVADGFIVSTPAGSSAYNFSAGGRMIPLESKLLCLTPVCSYKPKRWPGAIIQDDSVIKLEILDEVKRPVNGVADFLESHDIKLVEIFKRQDIFAELIFNSHVKLSERFINEQFVV